MYVDVFFTQRTKMKLPKASRTKRLSKRDRKWHTKNEKQVVKLLGGKPHHPGFDAYTKNGTPFEVREAKKSGLYRLQKDVHDSLMKGNGFYVFKKGPQLKKMKASAVDKKIKHKKWAKDRKYPYKFLQEKSVF